MAHKLKPRLVEDPWPAPSKLVQAPQTSQAVLRRESPPRCCLRVKESRCQRVQPTEANLRRLFDCPWVEAPPPTRRRGYGATVPTWVSSLSACTSRGRRRRRPAARIARQIRKRACNTRNLSLSLSLVGRGAMGMAHPIPSKKSWVG